MAVSVVGLITVSVVGFGGGGGDGGRYQDEVEDG